MKTTTTNTNTEALDHEIENVERAIEANSKERVQLDREADLARRAKDERTVETIYRRIDTLNDEAEQLFRARVALEQKRPILRAKDAAAQLPRLIAQFSKDVEALMTGYGKVLDAYYRLSQEWQRCEEQAEQLLELRTKILDLCQKFSLTQPPLPEVERHSLESMIYSLSKKVH